MLRHYCHLLEEVDFLIPQQEFVGFLSSLSGLDFLNHRTSSRAYLIPLGHTEASSCRNLKRRQKSQIHCKVSTRSGPTEIESTSRVFISNKDGNDSLPSSCRHTDLTWDTDIYIQFSFLPGATQSHLSSSKYSPQ